jgi:TRAP-type C4-dicarboxylate transport system permease small subunit
LASRAGLVAALEVRFGYDKQRRKEGEAMGGVERWIQKIIQMVRYVSAALLVLMLAITTVHVVCRYVFNRPIMWSEEMSVLLLIWFGYFAISNELYTEGHIAISMFYDKFPPALQKAADILKNSVIILFSVLMMGYVIYIALSIGENKLPVSGIPKVMMYLPIAVASFLMMVYGIILLIRCAGKDYRRDGEEMN